MNSVKFKEVSQIKQKLDSLLKTDNDLFNTFLSQDCAFVKGTSVFLTGTSGSGKTTLSINLQNMIHEKSLFYSREMSKEFVKKQMLRYKVENDNAFIVDKKACPNLDSFIKELNELKPKIVFVDSLQVLIKEDYGNVSSDKALFEIIQTLRTWAEENCAVMIIIGHVNKDGEFEGKNTIQHLFDAHLEMIYDKKKNIRTMTWAKNRFGNVDKKLFYKFGENSIIFSELIDKKTLDENIFEMISNFIKSVKYSPNYKIFEQELNDRMNKISTLKKTQFVINVEILKIMDELSKKYKI